MEKQIHAYKIPDKYFKPHNVVVPFHAKVVYTVQDGKPVIEEIAVTPRCLRYINNPATMVADIEKELEAKVCRNTGVHETMRSLVNSMAPHT